MTIVGAQGLIGGMSLLGEEFQHCRQFHARDLRGRSHQSPFPITLLEEGPFSNAEPFRAIGAGCAIRAQMPAGQNAVQQNQEKAWAAFCRHSPCSQTSKSDWDLKYVLGEWETEYLHRECHVYNAHRHRTDIQPSTDLVASEQPSDRSCWIYDRIA